MRALKYSKDSISTVLQATDIVGLVGATLELKSSGAGRFKALCPFHREKTPSFTVNADRQIYHCFGCGKGGDALSFTMEYHGLSFAEALKNLADRAGVRLPEQASDSKADFIRTRLLEFNVFAAKHFEANLHHAQAGNAGREYLAKRRLSDETLRRFALGYAPESWSDLLDAAGKERFEADVINACGMFKANNRGGSYDFFRNRVTFPIKDVNGRIVAFGGRTLGDDPAKYINSPETPVYKKSNILYGLHEGRDAIRREKRAILVEGYFDVLRCFDAGVENVIAPCGTALTAEQAHLIHRYANEVIVLFDGDAAGIKAALKGIRVLTAAGLTVRALALPDNQDPDDFVGAHGAAVFLELLNGARDFIAFYAAASESRMESVEGRNEVLHELFEIVHGMDNAVRADEYLKHMARELNLSEWACSQEFSKYQREPRRFEAPKRDEPGVTPVGYTQDDCDFVTALLAKRELLDYARHALAEIPIVRTHLAELLEVLFQDVPPGMVMQHLENAQARQLYTAAVNREEIPGTDHESLVGKHVRSLCKKAKESQAGDIMLAIQQAEQARDHMKVAELLREKIKLQQELEQVGLL